MLDFMPQTNPIYLGAVKRILLASKEGIYSDEYCISNISSLFSFSDISKICKHYGITYDTFISYSYNLPSRAMITRIYNDVLSLCNRHC